MALETNISWCDHTINLWWGCTKVHTGCKNCYAEHLSDNRYKKNLWGDNGSRQRIVSAFKDLDKCQRIAAKNNTIAKVFCGSMMDIFEQSKALSNPVDQFISTNDLRQELFNRIDSNKYPNLVFLFLTKRPEHINSFIPKPWLIDSPKNVWFGASVSNQKTYAKMCAELIQVNSPNLFLSCEPQTDLIEIGANAFSIKWIIQGGESGHKKRPFNLKWAYIMKERCATANISFFFKQIDKVLPVPEDLNCNEFPIFHVSELNENRFSHTLENCLFAKQELMKGGFKEDDFYLHDVSYSDSYLNNEPMMKCSDDDCISALELYKQKCFSEEVDEDKMIDFFFGNNS